MPCLQYPLLGESTGTDGGNAQWVWNFASRSSSLMAKLASFKGHPEKVKQSVEG